MKRLSAREYARVLVAAATQVPSTQRHEVVARFLQLLRRQRASNLLPRIMTQLQQLYDTAAGLTRVNISTARAIDASHIEKVLSTALGKVAVDTTVHPELIAGLTVQVGDHLIDGSVRGQLQRLHTQLTSSHA